MFTQKMTEDVLIFLPIALKTTILSDPLINCLPVVTTANIEPSTLLLSLQRGMKCENDSPDSFNHTSLTLQFCFFSCNLTNDETKEMFVRCC